MLVTSGVGSLVLALAVAHIVARDGVASTPAQEPSRPAIRDRWREAGSEFEIVIEGSVTPAASLEGVRVGEASRLFLRERRVDGQTRELEVQRTAGTVASRWRVDGEVRPLGSEAREWSRPLLEITRDVLELVSARRAIGREWDEFLREPGQSPSAGPAEARQRRLRDEIELLARKRNTLIEDPGNRRSHAAQLVAERSALELQREELRLRRSLRAPEAGGPR
jgi:hypothetical protein